MVAQPASFSVRWRAASETGEQAAIDTGLGFWAAPIDTTRLGAGASAAFSWAAGAGEVRIAG